MTTGIVRLQARYRAKRHLQTCYSQWYDEVFDFIFSLSHQYDTHPARVFRSKDQEFPGKELYGISTEFNQLPTKTSMILGSSNIHSLLKLRNRCHTLMREIGGQSVRRILESLCPEMLYDLTQAEAFRLRFWGSLMTPVRVQIAGAENIPEKSNQGVDDLYICFQTRIIPKQKNVSIMFQYEYSHVTMTIIRAGKHATLDVLFHPDKAHAYRSHKYFRDKVSRAKRKLDEIPIEFQNGFLEQLSVKTLVVESHMELVERTRMAFKRSKQLQNTLFHAIMTDVKSQRLMQKLETISLLLLSPQSNRRDAELILDFMSKDTTKAIEARLIQDAIDISLSDRLTSKFSSLKDLRQKRQKMDRVEVSYESRIESMMVSDEIKQKAFTQLKTIKRSKDGDVKLQTYLDNLLRIPFGVYRQEDMLAQLDGIARAVAALQTQIVTTFEGEDPFRVEILEQCRHRVRTEHHIEDWLQDMKSCFIKNHEQIEPLQLESFLKRVIHLMERLNSFRMNKMDYMKRVRKCLDKSVYGHRDAKNQLERIVCQWITGKNDGMILGLQGPPGVGKTSIIKDGLSKCLVDAEGKSRPFAFLPVGGLSGASLLVGHNYTYQGSKWGRIADILMDAKCMNPIIFIDELDKISRTERGEEVVGILTHLTDSTQNTHFYDRYFAGIPLDLSKVMIIFSFNDIDKVDRVLRDRITCIRVDPLDTGDKLEISRQFLLPDILDIVGFRSNDIQFPEDQVRTIIQTYTFEAGVRHLKQILYHIVRELNRRLSYGSDIKLPLVITSEFLTSVLSTYHRHLRRRVAKVPQIGVINGMYANTLGVGGITTIEVSRFRCKEHYGFKLTGQQGDVMKESMECAKTVAFNLLNKPALDSYIANPYGLHIHCPEASVRKDGPSAGGAIAIAIYSYLSQLPIRSTVAITGEIDLHGNIRAVGGLHAKLHGVKSAGVRLALVPRENEEDIRRLKLRGKLPVDSDFAVQFVDNVADAIVILIPELKTKKTCSRYAATPMSF